MRRVVRSNEYPKLPEDAPRAPGKCPDFDVQAFLTFDHRKPFQQQVAETASLLHRAVPGIHVIQMIRPSMEAIYKPLQDRWPIAPDAIKTAAGETFEDAHYSRAWVYDMVDKDWGVLYYVPRGRRAAAYGDPARAWCEGWIRRGWTASTPTSSRGRA